MKKLLSSLITLALLLAVSPSVQASSDRNTPSDFNVYNKSIYINSNFHTENSENISTITTYKNTNSSLNITNSQNAKTVALAKTDSNVIVIDVPSNSPSKPAQSSTNTDTTKTPVQTGSGSKDTNSSTKTSNTVPITVPSKPAPPKYSISKTDIRFYNTIYKEIIAIPITYSFYKNTNAQGPVYSVSKKGTRLEITLPNSSINSSFIKTFTNMKKSVKLENISGSKVKLTVDFAATSDVDIYKVKRKPRTSSNLVYYKDFLVISLYDKKRVQEANSIKLDDITPDKNSEDNTAETDKTLDSQNSANSNNDTELTPEEIKLQKLKSKYTITIDPGHGGKDPGASGNGLMEKLLNLDISLRVKAQLEKEGYDVYITRSDDNFVDLYDRADIGNILKSDLFLCIHNNANGKSTYNGTTVLYNSKASKPQKALATMMRDSVANALQTTKLRLEDRPGLVVLNSTNVPAILVEVGVLTNPSDAVKLTDYSNLDKVADAMVQTINKNFGFEKR